MLSVHHILNSSLMTFNIQSFLQPIYAGKAEMASLEVRLCGRIDVFGASVEMAPLVYVSSSS